MADESFVTGFAVAAQTVLGTAVIDPQWDTATVAFGDGAVLGDRESGDAESGITLPEFARVARARADVAGSFTRQPGSFTRTDVNSLAITIPMQGNGITATPSVGEAQPDVGIDTLWQMAGLVGANGGAQAEYDYTPRIGTTGPPVTLYGTVCLWTGTHRWYLQDCICDSTVIEFTPGGIALATFNIAVGSVNQFDDDITFPTSFTYNNQATVSAPSIGGVASTAWDVTKGYNTLTVTINQEVVDVEDSNQATGIRKVQNARTINVDGTIFLVAADSDFEYQNLIDPAAPTDDLIFQVGTATTGATAMNAFQLSLNNLQTSSLKYNRLGAETVVEVSNAFCTSTGLGTEFELQYN